MHSSRSTVPNIVVSFTTDIPVLAPAWGEPFLFGPGSIHVRTRRRKKFQSANCSARSILRANDRMLLSRRSARA